MMQIIFLRTIFIYDPLFQCRAEHIYYIAFSSVSVVWYLFSRCNVQSLYLCIFTNPQTFIYLHIEMRETNHDDFETQRSLASKWTLLNWYWYEWYYSRNRYFNNRHHILHVVCVFGNRWWLGDRIECQSSCQIVESHKGT